MISKILCKLKRNGSPLPEFGTDADRTYMITTIKVHEVLMQKDYNKVNTIVSFMKGHGEITPKEAEAITGKSATRISKNLPENDHSKR